MSTTAQTLLETALAAKGSRYVGLAGATTRDGDVAFSSAGRTHVDPAQGGRVDESTVFEIGSITKVFTSLLLADAVVAGEVSLDEPLQTFHPEMTLPVRGRPVTLVDLATHTSGFPRLPAGLIRQAFRHGDDPYARFTDEHVSNALVSVRLKREPGAKLAYSNFGAAVLGNALAARAGTTYEALLSERVLVPLGLGDTSVRLRPDQEARRAHGHRGRGRPTPDWSMPSMPAMGALHSTASDLSRFVTAQLEPEGTALAEALRLTQEPRAGRPPRQIGLGWMVSPLGRSGLTCLWHNGGTGGARSLVGIVPGHRTGVVLLTNCVRALDRTGFRLLEQLATGSGADDGV